VSEKGFGSELVVVAFGIDGVRDADIRNESWVFIPGLGVVICGTH